MQRVNLPEFMTKVDEWCSSNDTITVWGIYEETQVNYGGDDCNIEYCREHNIPCYKSRDDGGCIVNGPGTINIADFRPSVEGWIFPLFLNDFTQYLKDKKLNAEYDGNDVLIDGYKVASGFGYNLSPEYKRQYTGLGFFFNTDEELIRHICTKPMVKKPKGLEQFGITTEECVEWMMNWFENFNKKA